jgi:hypothetical protein
MRTSTSMLDETFTLRQVKRIARKLDRRERDFIDRRRAQRELDRPRDEDGTWILTVRGVGGGHRPGQRILDAGPYVDKSNEVEA